MAEERTGAWLPPNPSPPSFAAPPEPQPEPRHAPLYKAGWWARVGATLLDALIIVAGALILGAIGAAIGGGDGFAAGFWIGYAIGFLLYAPLMLAYHHGQTLGKQATGIRVVHRDGEPIGLGRAWLREVPIKYVCGIIPLIDVLWPLWEERNRALHDLVAVTRVVQA
jgi:uncharacterized RDD family membrane protein YckC